MEKKLTFIAERGGMSSNGDQLVLSDATFPDKVPIHFNFKDPIIGEASLRLEEGAIIAEASVDFEEAKGLKLFPAVSGRVLKAEHPTPSTRRILGFSIEGVSLCPNPNADPTIEAIEI